MDKYLVALSVDCEADFSYTDYQIIEAPNKEEARLKYNEINNCSYFYGRVLAKVNDAHKVEQCIRHFKDAKVLLELSFDGAIEKVV